MANRYIRVAGGNYNAAATWESSPGAADVVTVPGASDAAIGHATSGNLTITAAAAAQSIDLSAYVGTLVINSSQTWTVSGGVTLGAGMTWVATTGTIATGTAGTWTSNGITIPCAFSITAAVTITLADAMIVGGTFTCSATGSTTISGGFTLRCNGNVTLSGTLAAAAGAQFRFGGTGNWVGSSTGTRRLQMPTTIDTAGTLTLSANCRIGNGGSLTYVSGTIVATDDIYISGNTSLAVAGMTNASFTVDAVSTVTLTENWNAVQIGLGSNLTMAGSFTTTTTTLLFFATSTLARAGAWNITTLQVNAGAFTASLTGAFDQTLTNLRIFSGAAVALTSGRVLTVTTEIFMTAAGTASTATLRSVTGSSAITLDYQGGNAGNRIFRATFTDVNMATGQKLWNYHGQTLTRTNGIVNFTSPPVPRMYVASA